MRSSTLVEALSVLLASTCVIALGAPHAQPAAADLTGHITVRISSPRLKHWGLPGGHAAYVPATDHSAVADAIRTAPSALALCAALSAAKGMDPHIVLVPIDGDGDFEHRSGDAESMRFEVVIPNPTQARTGSLFVCSRPAFAMMTRGAYPDELYYKVNHRHVFAWRSGPLKLRPGKTVPLRFSWNIDASSW